MLYKPTYCCNCGDKIERIEWKLWTSGKFCENCEPDFRRQEWLPKIFLVGIAVLSGLFGFGSYLKKPEKSLEVTTSRVAVNSPDKNQNTKRGQILTNTAVQSAAQNQTANSNLREEAKTRNVSASPINRASAENLQNSGGESVYFCGAQTKKGTPCTRRVKGGGRCWQHMGQLAILPKEKLFAGQ